MIIVLAQLARAIRSLQENFLEGHGINCKVNLKNWKKKQNARLQQIGDLID
jgi:hypothetical protein